MTDPPHATAEPGLRARKKAATRTAISDVATRLFVERGFDDVTVADVADEADVSVKTVFNYFGSKEELFFDREAGIRDLIVATVAGRPPGLRPTEALGGLLEARCIPDRPGWGVVEDPKDRAAFRAFLRTWEEAPTLRARALVGSEQLAEALRAALAAEVPEGCPEEALRTFASVLAGAVHLRQRAVAEALLAGAGAARVRARARAAAREALGRAAAAFPDLDRPAG